MIVTREEVEQQLANILELKTAIEQSILGQTVGYSDEEEKLLRGYLALTDENERLKHKHAAYERALKLGAVVMRKTRKEDERQAAVVEAARKVYTSGLRAYRKELGRAFAQLEGGK